MAKDYAIYISSHSIAMVEGANEDGDVIRLYNFKELPLSEGAMINGIIMDETQVVNVLKEISKDGITAARIVIDSGQILLKNLVVPLLKKKELMVIVKDELANINETYEDLIYDYSVLRNICDDKDTPCGEILCCAMERKLLVSYLDLFQRANIRVESVDVSLNALQKLTQEMPQLRGKSYIIAIVDYNNLFTYLFENNTYVFVNRTRLFTDRGSESLVNEIQGNISQMIQFNTSRKSPYKIDTVYFCGLHDEEEIVFANIKQNLQIEASVFPNAQSIHLSGEQKEKDFKMERYVIPLGCLLRK